MGYLNAWPIYWKLAFGFAPFLIGLTGLGMSMIMTRDRAFIPVMKLVEKSPHFHFMKVMSGTQGFLSRWLLMGCISGVVIYPQFYIRRGYMSPDALTDFPPRLKRLMVISLVLSTLGFIWMMALAAMIKISKMT